MMIKINAVQRYFMSLSWQFALRYLSLTVLHISCPVATFDKIGGGSTQRGQYSLSSRTRCVLRVRQHLLLGVFVRRKHDNETLQDDLNWVLIQLTNRLISTNVVYCT